MSDSVHFLNIDFLNMISFSQLTRFGKLAFFEFRLSFLSPNAFRRTGCIGCKLIFLADVLLPDCQPPPGFILTVVSPRGSP